MRESTVWITGMDRRNWWEKMKKNKEKIANRTGYKKITRKQLQKTEKKRNQQEKQVNENTTRVKTRKKVGV